MNMFVFLWFITTKVAESQWTTPVCGSGNHVCFGSLNCLQGIIMIEELSFYKTSAWLRQSCCKYRSLTDTLMNLLTYSATIFDLCSLKSERDLYGRYIKELPHGRWYSEIGYSCILPDKPVIDICSNSQVLVHGIGHIVYWPSQETYSSCVCHLHGETSVTIKTFSPLYKSDYSTCTSTTFINDDKIPCKTYDLYRNYANKIRLLTPGNDRLWATIYGYTVSVSCTKLLFPTETTTTTTTTTATTTESTSSRLVTTTTSKHIITTTNDSTTQTWTSFYRNVSINSSMITQPIGNQETESDTATALALGVGGGTAFLVACLLIVTFVLYRRRHLVQRKPDSNWERCSYVKNSIPKDEGLVVSEYATIQDGVTSVSLEDTNSNQFVNGKAIESCPVDKPLNNVYANEKIWNSSSNYSKAKNVFVKGNMNNTPEHECFEDKSKDTKSAGFVSWLRNNPGSVRVENGYELAKNVNIIDSRDEGKSSLDSVLEKGATKTMLKEIDKWSESDKRTDNVTRPGTDSNNAYDTTCLTENKIPKSDATYSHLEIADDTYDTTFSSTIQDGISSNIDTYAHLDESKNNYNSAVASNSPDIDATYSHLKQ